MYSLVVNHEHLYGHVPLLNDNRRHGAILINQGRQQ